MNRGLDGLVTAGAGTENSPYQLKASKVESTGEIAGRFLRDEVIPQFNVLEDGLTYLECSLATFELSYNAEKGVLTLRINLKPDFFEQRSVETSMWLRNLLLTSSLLNKSPKKTVIELYANGEMLEMPKWAQRTVEA